MAMVDANYLIEKELRIYRRSNESPNFYIGLKFPNKQEIHISAKTANKNTATQFAYKKFFEYQNKIEQGISTQVKSFTSVANSYLKFYEKNLLRHEKLEVDGNLDKNFKNEFTRNQLNEKNQLLNRFIIPYFKGKNIHEINAFDIEDYKKHRMYYWVDGEGSKLDKIKTKDANGRVIYRKKTTREKKIPSPWTINRDLTSIRAVFNHAAEELRCMRKNDIPDIKRIIKSNDYEEKHETPSFSKDEFSKLRETLLKKYFKQKNPKHKKSHYRLLMYILVMASTGMRSSDTSSLKFSDCRIENNGNKKFFVIYVSSKNSTRKIIPMKECMSHINKLRRACINNSEEYEWEFTEDTHVFCNEYGKPIKSFRNALKNLYKDCDLEGRNTRSFRPFYITNAILTTKIKPEILAKNTGHSANTLNKYYDRSVATDNPELYDFGNLHDI